MERCKIRLEAPSRLPLMMLDKKLCSVEQVFLAGQKGMPMIDINAGDGWFTGTATKLYVPGIAGRRASVSNIRSAHPSPIRLKPVPVYSSLLVVVGWVPDGKGGELILSHAAVRCFTGDNPACEPMDLIAKHVLGDCDDCRGPLWRAAHLARQAGRTAAV